MRSEQISRVPTARIEHCEFFCSRLCMRFKRKKGINPKHSKFSIKLKY